MLKPAADIQSETAIFNEVNNYPIHALTDEEISDPYLVIDEIFRFGHLPELREMLWNSFKANITGTYHKALSAKKRSEVVILHEFIVKLVEAVYLIKRKRSTSAIER